MNNDGGNKLRFLLLVALPLCWIGGSTNMMAVEAAAVDDENLKDGPSRQVVDDDDLWFEVDDNEWVQETFGKNFELMDKMDEALDKIQEINLALQQQQSETEEEEVDDLFQAEDDDDEMVPVPRPAPTTDSMSYPDFAQTYNGDGDISAPTIARELFVPLPGGGCVPTVCCQYGSCVTFPSSPGGPNYSSPSRPNSPSPPSPSSPSRPSSPSSPSLSTPSYQSSPSRPTQAPVTPTAMQNQMSRSRSSNNNDGLSGGAIAGIVIALLLVISGVTTTVVFLVVCKRKQETKKPVAFTGASTKNNNTSEDTTGSAETSSNDAAPVTVVETNDDVSATSAVTTNRSAANKPKTRKVIKHTMLNADGSVRSVVTKTVTPVDP